jgi:predicted DNA-binding transcriptional regulator AlpA
MINFLSIPAAAKRCLLAPPSYYRLAADGLMPPVVKLAKNRSGVIEDELDTVLRARAVGMSNDEVRHLVQRIVAQRAERFGGDAA